MNENISVTVIGGYLGAGKTTLVNHILRTADQRVAVLVNDFGDINIDEDLIESNDGDTLALANGCICCSLVDGFASALNTIRELDPRPERLVIEASGVADPASVAAYGHAPGLIMDAIVVIVDAETIRRRSRDKYVGDTILGQLDSADIVVLNKVDLVSSVDVDTTREWLGTTCPEAVLVDSENSAVDPLLLFGVRPRVSGGVAVDPNDHAGHDHAERLFESWSWTGDRPLSRASIESLMDAMPEGVVRAKGLLWIEDDQDRVWNLQRVGRRWTMRPLGEWDSSPSSRIVAIGLHGAVDNDWLELQLG